MVTIYCLINKTLSNNGLKIELPISKIIKRVKTANGSAVSSNFS